MRMMAFARRNTLEILRDPLTLFFGVGFPLVLLALLSLIQSNIPVPLFMPEMLAPGIAVFGQSFIALFSALLISKDRGSALMMRLRVSPMGEWDFMLGYALPLVPMALLQGLMCLLAAIPLGLRPDWNWLLTIAVLLPGALFNIALGLICGCLFNERQVGGVCGALFTNVGAWLSGVWFDPALVGGVFVKITRVLPFANSVDAARSAVAGQLNFSCLLVICVYAAAACVLSLAIFARRLRAA